MIVADPISQIPIDAELANLHLRLSGDDDMQLLSHEMYLKGAAEWAESQTNRSFSSRKHYYTFDRFPLHGLMLPRGKCTAVESIKYWSGGVQVTLTGPTSSIPGTDYQEDLRSETGGILMPNPGESWPTVGRDYINPVEIEFTAGYSPYAPQDAQVAMLMYAADRLEMPTGLDGASTFRDPNLTAQQLLAPYLLMVFS